MQSIENMVLSLCETEIQKISLGLHNFSFLENIP